MMLASITAQLKIPTSHATSADYDSEAAHPACRLKRLWPWQIVLMLVVILVSNLHSLLV